jgi:hypothetical protein
MDQRHGSLNPVDKPPGDGESGFFFTIITLPERVPVAWGKKVDDPAILIKCAELKAQGIAYSVRPIVNTADILTAENMERGYKVDIPGFDGGTFTDEARKQIRDGSLYRHAE